MYANEDRFWTRRLTLRKDGVTLGLDEDRRSSSVHGYKWDITHLGRHIAHGAVARMHPLGGGTVKVDTVRKALAEIVKASPLPTYAANDLLAEIADLALPGHLHVRARDLIKGDLIVLDGERMTVDVTDVRTDTVFVQPSLAAFLVVENVMLPVNELVNVVLAGPGKRGI